MWIGAECEEHATYRGISVSYNDIGVSTYVRLLQEYTTNNHKFAYDTAIINRTLGIGTSFSPDSHGE